MRSRFVPLLCASCLLSAGSGPLLRAAEPSRSYPDFNYLEPRLMMDNVFSASARLTGRVSASFGNLGSIASVRSLDDMTSELGRSYDDGYVGLDSRSTTDGTDLADDYRTNNWAYASTSQVAADATGIAFHAYSSTTSGASLESSSGALNGGIDLEYSRTIGRFGRRRGEIGRPFTWGFTSGLSLSDLNVKARGRVAATLHVLTDFYSLLGAEAPIDVDPDDGVAYSAPSSETVTVTNPDGSTTSYTVDTTTYLANRPEWRNVESFLNGADVEGFWQVKGAALSFRVGSWVRWQPTEGLALRLSAGGAVSLAGLKMRYDETLWVDESVSITELNETADAKVFGAGGVFGAFDAEWWLTRKTGFFGTAFYEKYSDAPEMELSGRTANLQFSNGLGIRFGISTRF